MQVQLYTQISDQLQALIASGGASSSLTIRRPSAGWGPCWQAAHFELVNGRVQKR